MAFKAAMLLLAYHSLQAIPCILPCSAGMVSGFPCGMCLADLSSQC